MNVIACSAMVLAFAACNNNKVTHVAQIVDYRVHDANGALSRAADNSEPDPAPFVPSEDFEWELLDEIKLFDKGRGVKGPEFSKVTYKNTEGHLINCFKDECHDGDADWAPYECDKDYYQMMKDAIKFEDDPDGVKLVFTKPAGYDNATFIVFQYIDGNGNRSTLIDRDDWGTFFNKGDFEIVYPQVIAGKPAQFWVMINNENESQPGTNFFYKVTPAHGKGIVYDMQLDYDETDYIS